jgi:hypothetical protein
LTRWRIERHGASGALLEHSLLIGQWRVAVERTQEWAPCRRSEVAHRLSEGTVEGLLEAKFTHLQIPPGSTVWHIQVDHWV